MNIFHKVALQGLIKNSTRTLVTITGVVLSAALFTGVATFAVSLQHYTIEGAAVKYGSWHVELPDGDETVEAGLTRDDRVSDTVMLQNIGYASLDDSKNEDKPYLFLSGWDEHAFDTLPVKLLSGRLPENSSEILIPSHLAANGGVKIPVGETITLEVGARVSGDRTLSQHDPYVSGEERLVPSVKKTYTVVGICQRPSMEEYSAPGYTLITAADGAAADSQSIFITLKNPWKLHSYLKTLEGKYPYVLNNDVLRFMGLSGEKIFTVLLYTIVGVLGVLVVVGSVFLIYNAFHISLNERTHQFGILMSVGATKKQLCNSVLFEGLCIGVVGIPLGILAGLPGIKAVLSLVEKNFANVMYDNVPLTMEVSVPAVIGSAAVSFITILISAYIPAKKAAAIPVMECIRQTNEVKVHAKDLKSSRFAQQYLSLEKILALKNFKRNKRRYRSIILSLTFSVVLFVASSVFCGYLNQIASNSSEVIEKYDIVFSSRDMSESEMLGLYDELKNVDGVTVSGYQAEEVYPCTIGTDQLSEHFLDTFGEFLDYDSERGSVNAMLDVMFVDEGIYEKQLQSLGLSKEEYSPAESGFGQNEKILMAGYIEGYLYMQEEPMEISLTGADGSEAKTIHAVYVNDYPDTLPAEAGDSFRGYSLRLILPYSAKAQFEALGTASMSTLGMTFESDNPGGSTSRMQTIIDANGITADYSLYNVYGVLEQNRNLSFIVNLFAFVFIVMITLISIANVFNTISTNIRLRRRELAMLRSVGMSDRDFQRMMRFECFLYGARTMLWGLPLSVMMSILIYRFMVLGGGFQLHYIFPWGSMGISILGVFLIVFITMLYASDKVRKENIIDALRDEMT